MGLMYCIGLDVHKLKISYCVKDVIGRIRAQKLSKPKIDLRGVTGAVNWVECKPAH
jgi:hypothetical protein